MREMIRVRVAGFGSAFLACAAGPLLPACSQAPPGDGLPGVADADVVPPRSVGEADFIVPELVANPTMSSTTLSVMPREALEVRVAYGRDGERWLAQTEPQVVPAGVRGTFLLDGLEPGQTTDYQVEFRERGAREWNERPPGSFRSLRAAGDPVRFIFGADGHIYRNFALTGKYPIWAGSVEHFKINVLNLLGLDADFFVTAGDEAMTHCLSCPVAFVDDESAGVDTVHTLREAELRYQRIFQQDLYGALTSSLAFYTVLGNHDGETLFGSEDGLCKHYDNTNNLSETARLKHLPNPYDTYGGSVSGNYFSWESGDALFVIIDSYKYVPELPRSVEDWTLGPEQLRWLEDTLASSKKPWKVIFAPHIVGGSEIEMCYHYGRGGIRSTDDGTPRGTFLGEQAKLHELMKTHGVQLFLYGHDHVALIGEKLDAQGDGEGVHYVLGGQMAVNQSSWIETEVFQQQADWDEDGKPDYPLGWRERPSVGAWLVEIEGQAARLRFLRATLPDSEQAELNGEAIYDYTVRLDDE